MLEVFFRGRFPHFSHDRNKAERMREFLSDTVHLNTVHIVFNLKLSFLHQLVLFHSHPRKEEKKRNCSNQFMFSIYWIFRYKNERTTEIYTQLLASRIMIICSM